MRRTGFILLVLLAIWAVVFAAEQASPNAKRIQELQAQRTTWVAEIAQLEVQKAQLDREIMARREGILRVEGALEILKELDDKAAADAAKAKQGGEKPP